MSYNTFPCKPCRFALGMAMQPIMRLTMIYVNPNFNHRLDDTTSNICL